MDSNDVQLITDTLVATVLQDARQSPRGRMTHTFHSGPTDNPQRFLNVLSEGTYIPPHRHVTPPKAESLVVLDGYIAVFIFEEDGQVRKGYLVGTGREPEYLPKLVDRATAARGIDLAPCVWHTIATLTDHAVCFEVKAGPWEPGSDRELASWAPREGDANASSYLAGLLA
jgi:cupin fold WbuC family metalloprotein